jgi:hypothetical protein
VLPDHYEEEELEWLTHVRFNTADLTNFWKMKVWPGEIS